MLSANGYQVSIWSASHRPAASELAHFCQGAAGLISLWTDAIDAHLFQQCPSLKVVCNYAAGYNNMHIEDARQHQVVLCNTPGVLTEATADFSFLLLQALARQLVPSVEFIKNNRWHGFDPLGHMGTDLRGKILGIVGMGNMGFEMARLCHAAFHMPVLYNARSAKPEAEKQLGARQCSFEQLLAEADVVSVHVDLNDSTRHMFDYDAFSKMKKTALFINTARGPVHKEEDLICALEQKEIAGAALDVCDPEPMHINNPLLSMKQVIVTPHIASSTEATRSKMAEMAAQSIIDVLSGKQPENRLT
jgi:lactate dehydrogenase-like 2-hydroxyacid dehydrogenase